MPLTAALNLTGNKTGQIKGNIRQKTREDQIAVTGVSHEIRTPSEADGMPGAKPTHGVFVVTKDVDHASPLLHKAQAEGDTFSQWALMFFRLPPSGGQEENHYTIVLTEAKIAWIRTSMPYSRKNENFPLPESEDVAFAYKGIAWEWHGKDAGKSTGKEPQAAFAAGDWESKLDATISKAIKEHATAQAKAFAEAVKVAVKEALAKPAP